MSIDFTDEQIKAISYPGNVVLTACPGSGKTAVIVERIINDISLCNDYHGVIAISYTNKASEELRKRCCKLLPDIKSSFFGTMDKFYLNEIVYPYIKHLWGKCENLVLMKFKDLNEDWQEYLNEYTQDSNICDNITTYSFEKIHQLYNKGFIILEFIPLISFFILNKSKSCNRYLLSKYTSVFVDEYQDTGLVQHKIFIHLSRIGIRATAVGDVDQSIYSYAGRSPEYLLELKNKENSFKPFEITVNHRSHPSIVNYANRLINKDCELLNYDVVYVRKINIKGSQKEISAWIDSQISIIKNEFNITKESDIAILLATNNSVSLIASLLKTSCRAYLDDDLSKIGGETSNLIKDLLMLKYSKKMTVQSIIDGSRNKILSNDRIKELRKILSCVKKADENELIPAIRISVRELIGDEINSNHIDAIHTTINSSMMLNNYLPMVDNEVQIMTLHKSKGLEFDYVFHLDLYDWILPRREYIKGCYDEVFTNYSQCLNLHYVGITRAKKCVALVNSTLRYNFQNEIKQAKPSQFLSREGLNGLFSNLI